MFVLPRYIPRYIKIIEMKIKKRNTLMLNSNSNSVIFNEKML